jgi:hypothetical protein
MEVGSKNLTDLKSWIVGPALMTISVVALSLVIGFNFHVSIHAGSFMMAFQAVSNLAPKAVLNSFS